MGPSRPAAVIGAPGRAWARHLPNGGTTGRIGQPCVDFAYITAVGTRHWHVTARGNRATDAYVERERRHNGTESRCSERGLGLGPVVVDGQREGGSGWGGWV